MPKIRILHIAQANGGVERYLKTLFKNMDSSKYENILVCSMEYDPKDYEGLASHVERVRMERAIGANDLKAMASVRKLIRKYHPDIVYAHSSKAGAIARIADLGIRNTCVYNPHGWAFNMNCSEKKKQFYVLIERLLSHFCRKIVCISESEKRSALSHRICRENKLAVITNGIDLDACKPTGAVTRRDLNIPEDAYVIGTVGRICEQKATDVFIKAAALIKEQIPDAYFIIVGDILQDNDQDLKDYVFLYAKEHGLSDSLAITGWTDCPQDYVALFDAACLLSRWEGFGLVLPEYMAAGKPIVASSVDAIPDIIQDRRNGLLVPKDDPEAAALAVTALHDDPTLAQALAGNGSSDVKTHFDARRVAKQSEGLFDSLMSRTKSRGKEYTTVRTERSTYTNEN